ncbi:MAG TPA: hypothetical protein VE135_10800 [Pyrinomonadaceae bacterium]|nr:hypothetical protein [Pyrinomonadaceae bacterium]
MKSRTIVLTVASVLIAVTVCLAQSPQMGTWKLNEAKSKFAPGAPKNTTVVYEAAGDSIKVTTDGVDVTGAATHSEWTGKFDGADYPVTGDANADTRAYKQVNDHTLELTNKKAGKVVLTGKIVVSADGKSRTLTTNSTDSKGMKMKNMAVYDKQ